MTELDHPLAQRMLKLLGTLELLAGFWLLYITTEAAASWLPSGPEDDPRSWPPIAILLLIPITGLALTSAIAAFQRWSNAWFWQVFGITSLVITLYLAAATFIMAA